MLRSYATVKGTLAEGQITDLVNRGFEVHQDPVRGTFILIMEHGNIPLEKRLEKASELSSVNDTLNENHSKFSEGVGDAIGDAVDYLDILLMRADTMTTVQGNVRGFSLVSRPSGFEIMNDPVLTATNPYILGYGSLFNLRETAMTFDRSSPPIDFSYDRAFWVIASGFNTRFQKVPTRRFWSQDPAEIANSAVLDIQRDPEGILVAIVYDANSAKKQQHQTFMRERDYRYEEISDIKRVISNSKGNVAYDSNRPIFAVKAHKIKFGNGHYYVIEALPTANPLLNYLETIVRGVLHASEITGEEGKDLLELYAHNTIMSDGESRLIDHSLFRQTLETVTAGYNHALSAAQSVLGKIGIADTVAE